MMKRLVILLLFVPKILLAQIEVSFPQSRAVFQRNNANYTFLNIAGSYSQNINRVEARLIPLQGGTAIDWTTIQENPNFGFYRGTLLVYGGWYRLEIRGKLDNQIISTTVVDKVGVGEVFVIAGQSNASGYDNFGNISAGDDRVNCVTNYYSSGENNDPPYPQVSQLSANVKIAPFGNGSWCWGRLGDLLAQRLNVPILFLNAAWEAMASSEWKSSSDGARGYNYYSGNYAPPGYPYGNLQKSLQYYASLYGVRSVLWHQGETDTDENTSAQNYKNNLQYVINKTRSQTGKNLSWVVARVSRSKLATSQAVIDGQNLTIQQVANVFAGPNTDLITDRIDGVHFYGSSLITLAQAWNSSLDNNFFASSTPNFASVPLALQSFCTTSEVNTPIRLTMQVGFKSYNWSNNDVRDITLVRSGEFSGKAKDTNGNTYFLPTINLREPIIPTKPTLSANGGTSFCPGKNVTLSSSYGFRNYWSTGDLANSITVNSGGDFYVTHVNIYGCVATSDISKVAVLPAPTASFTADGPTTFCSDKSLKLTSNAASGNLWSNGATSASITVNQTGNFSLSVTNEFGCSNTSQALPVKVAPAAPVPTIVAEGATTFCADKTVRIFTNLSNNIIWSNGSTASSIIVNQSGDYSVTASNEFGCKNNSGIIPIKVNPLPDKPNITADGPTIFCADKSINLTSSVATNNIWSNGLTDKNIKINKSGDYSVTVKNQFGCTQTSSLMSIKVNPLPPQPTITANGPTIFCADQKVTLSSSQAVSYDWSNGAKTQSITSDKSGDFSLKITDQNGCISLVSPTTSVTAKALPSTPTILQTGTYTLEQNSNSFATGLRFEWQLNAEKLAFSTPKIKAKVGGNYLVKSAIDYTIDGGNKLTCLSVPSSPYNFILAENNRGISIYPNPSASGYVNIETFEDIENAEVTIYSMKGFPIEGFSVPKFDDRKTFNVRNIPRGTYLLQVKSANFNVTKRIMLD